MVVACLAGAVVLIDQITKVWAEAELAGKPAVEVVGELLRFTYVRNPGGAFSLGTDYTWLFTLAALAVSIGIVVFAPRIRSGWWLVALGLLLGGAAGNLIDRATQPPGFGTGYVRDFLQLPNWPVFNVADMAVVGGAVLIVVLSVLGVPATDEGPDEEAEPETSVQTVADAHRRR